MKKLPLLLLAIISCFGLIAQSTSFQAQLKPETLQFAQYKTSDDWLHAAKKFQKLTFEFPQEWMGYYFESLCYVQSADALDDKGSDQAMSHLDLAQTAIEKAGDLSKANEEILVLQGFIYLGRIWESPFLNGAIYGRKIGKLVDQVNDLNSFNPRSHLLKGMLVFDTPRFVGGGKEAAKPHFVKAEGLFLQENKSNLISWGSHKNEQMLRRCGVKELE